MPSARLSEGVTITWSFTDNPWFLIIGNLIHVKIGPHVGNSRDMSEAAFLENDGYPCRRSNLKREIFF
jgi:hypothetical protein